MPETHTRRNWLAKAVRQHVPIAACGQGFVHPDAEALFEQTCASHHAILRPDAHAEAPALQSITGILRPVLHLLRSGHRPSAFPGVSPSASSRYQPSARLLHHRDHRAIAFLRLNQRRTRNSRTYHYPYASALSAVYPRRHDTLFTTAACRSPRPAPDPSQTPPWTLPNPLAVGRGMRSSSVGSLWRCAPRRWGSASPEF